jgi:hippurate hydrolase
MMDLIALRRTLHQHPELSGEELGTAAYIKKILTGLSAFKIHDLAHTGIMAELDTGQPGPSIMFRAELDALPIE